MKHNKVAASPQEVFSSAFENPSVEHPGYRDCLEQADICCEQARVAARLKRFRAAFGLFATAQSLYRRAMTLGGNTCADAKERLHHITVEMAAYGELAKSVARPVRRRAQAPESAVAPASTRPQLRHDARHAGR